MLQKLLTFFQQKKKKKKKKKKNQHICVSLNVNFNESLTNGIVSFEQLGRGYYSLLLHSNVRTKKCEYGNTSEKTVTALQRLRIRRYVSESTK